MTKETPKEDSKPVMDIFEIIRHFGDSTISAAAEAMSDAGVSVQSAQNDFLAFLGMCLAASLKESILIVEKRVGMEAVNHWINRLLADTAYRLSEANPDLSIAFSFEIGAVQSGGEDE